ncbi:DUF6790 family protein [Pseudonocardia parietis]|uniref:DUF6790 family protein n=1 Tax=Pseudonocardia parietis TaxID=570936 RepID=UPI0035585E99
MEPRSTSWRCAGCCSSAPGRHRRRGGRANDLRSRHGERLGWQTNGFQYEIGFASTAIGLGGIYASTQDAPAAWIVAAQAGGLFLLLAAVNHIVEIATTPPLSQSSWSVTSASRSLYWSC